MKLFKNITISILLFMFVLNSIVPISAKYSKAEIEKTAKGIVNWQKAKYGKDILFCDDFLSLAGSTNGDWYAVAFNRLGVKDSYRDYLKSLESYVTEKYKTSSKLSKYKATEWHRIILAVNACGSDAESFTENKINLVADGIYNFPKSLSSQGINGVIWGLIALDSKNYRVPATAKITRDDMIEMIIKAQQKDGGWATDNKNSDIDMTAMALQSLAKYKDRQQVNEAIEKGLKYISDNQKSSGGFENMGTETSESVSQVIIALNTLNIDINDQRFIKNNNTVIDALMEYGCSNGGFAHTKNTKADNIATQQALLAFVSEIRKDNNEKSIYDFSDNEIDSINLDNEGNLLVNLGFVFITGVIVVGIIILVKKKVKR